MDTPDKNAHLSPLLSEIKDYGPGEAAPEESEAERLESSESAAADTPAATEPPTPSEPPIVEPEPVPAAPAPAPAKGGSRLALYSLVVLWLLTLGGGFGAFVWQQTRVDALTVQLREQRAPLERRAAEAQRETERLELRVAALQEEAEELRTALATAESQAMEMAIAAANAETASEPEPEPEPAPEPETVLADPEPAPMVEEPAEPEPAAAAPAIVEAEPQAPAAAAGGWYVNLSTLSTEAAAVEWLQALEDAPANADIVSVQSGSRTLYRVRVGGFASREQARDAADMFTAQWRLSGVWISDR